MNQSDFSKLWREGHPKLLDASSEVPFFYGVYQRIADILLGGAMVIDKSVKADKARMMADTAAMCYTHFVEDLAGARTFEIISRHIPDCKDPILWIISMIRPVTELTEAGRKLLEAEITCSATQVESHLLLEWMVEKLNSDVFLDVKGVALWMLHNHYLMRAYAEAPMYDTLVLMTEFFDFTMESQQAA